MPSWLQSHRSNSTISTAAACITSESKLSESFTVSAEVRSFHVSPVGARFKDSPVCSHSGTIQAVRHLWRAAITQKLMNTLYFPFVNRWTATALEERRGEKKKPEQRDKKAKKENKHNSLKPLVVWRFGPPGRLSTWTEHSLKRTKDQGGWEAETERIHTAVLNSSTVHTCWVTDCSHPAGWRVDHDWADGRLRAPRHDTQGLVHAYQWMEPNTLSTLDTCAKWASGPMSSLSVSAELTAERCRMCIGKKGKIKKKKKNKPE